MSVCAWDETENRMRLDEAAMQGQALRMEWKGCR